MVKILSELHLQEKFIDYSSLPEDSAYLVFHSFTKKVVLDSLKTTPECLRKSMDYYYENPIELYYIYGDVVKELEKKEAKIDSLKQP